MNEFAEKKKNTKKMGHLIFQAISIYKISRPYLAQF